MKPLPIITREEAKALGLKRYFTGVLCSEGHISERYVCSRMCAECSRHRVKEFYDENREKVNERQRKKRSENRDQYRQYSRTYYLKNKEKIKTRSQLWKHNQSPDKKLERNRKEWEKIKSNQLLMDRQRVYWKKADLKRSALVAAAKSFLNQENER